MRTTRMLAGAASVAAAAAFGFATPAAAQPPQQSGLINVNISNLDVQVPIGVAANVCDVSVAVLAQLGPDDSAPCNATADPAATITNPDPEPGAPTQEGLVNVNISDLDVQIPIGIAANVCDLDVAVLAELGPGAASPCNATADPDALITILP
jgi:hypothetical protein